jgi:hypothetical protein
MGQRTTEEELTSGGAHTMNLPRASHRLLVALGDGTVRVWCNVLRAPRAPPQTTDGLSGGPHADSGPSADRVDDGVMTVQLAIPRCRACRPYQTRAP